MKKSKLAGVIILSVLAAAIIAVMVLSIIFKPDFSQLGGFSGTITEENSKIIGEYNIPVGKMEEINIKWKGGKIKLSTHSGDDIKIIERSKKDANDEKLSYSASDSKLAITENSHFEFDFTFFFNFSNEKMLEVYIPNSIKTSLDSIVVRATAADVDINAINIDNVQIETSSGDIKAEALKLNSCSLETTSGDISAVDIVDNDNQNDNSITLNSTSGDITHKNSNARVMQIGATSGECKIDTAKIQDTAEVSTTSGDVALKSVSANKITADSTSGNIKTEDCNSNNIEIETTSGDIICNGKHKKLQTSSTSGNLSAQGSFSDIDVDSISGDMGVTTDTTPTSFKSSSTSGNSLLILPKKSKDGFKVTFDSTSGNFNSNLPIVTNDDKRTYGNGKYSYTAESVSGDFVINSAGGK